MELGIRIGPKGRVTEIVLLSGPRELAEEAAAAVLQWRYKPYLINGEPTLVESTVAFDLPTSVAQPSTKPLKISDGLTLIKSVQPQYPANVQVSGPVLLKIVIGKDGSVQNIMVVKGHPMLVPAAIDAVKRWKYKPYLLNGEAVEVEAEVVVNFER